MIGTKVSRSASRMAVVQLLAKFFDFVALLVVARLLTPDDFGLVTLAGSVFLVANSLTELPVADVLVQRKELDERFLTSAFTLTALRGLLISAILLLLAPFVAQWLEDPRLETVIQVLAIAPVVQGLASPAMVRFLRDVDYVPLARTQLLGKLASFVAVLLLAWITRSYWALVAGLVVNPVVAAAATYVVAPWRPRLGIFGIRGILSFAGWVTLSRIIFTLNFQADRFFVGKILGKASLGQYAMSGDVATIATYTVAGAVMQPLFAGFARLSHERKRLVEAYLKGQQILITLVAPLGFGLAAVAESLVPLALGPQWLPTVPLIWLHGPALALQMMVVPVQSLTMAMAQPRLLVMRELIALLIRLPLTIWAAWSYGLLAAVMARAAVSVLMVLINLALARQLLQVPVLTQILSCGRAILASVLMAGVVVLVQAVLPTPQLGVGAVQTALAVGHLLVCVGAGALAYVAALLLFWHAAGRPEGAETWAIAQAQPLIRRLRRS